MDLEIQKIPKTIRNSWLPELYQFAIDRECNWIENREELEESNEKELRQNFWLTSLRIKQKLYISMIDGMKFINAYQSF